MKIPTKLQFYFLITLTALLTACGGSSGGNDDSVDNLPTTEPAIFGDNVVGIAQFGLLKNATVIIAKIPLAGGSLKLAFEEKTTGGDMRTAGRFNTHSSELEDKVYYIFATKGGTDIDPDGNGRENKSPFKGNSLSGAIVRGEWLKTLGNKAFRLTPLSTHITNISSDNISSYSHLREKLHATAKSYLKQDINGDGKLDMMDILVYNPLRDRAKVKDVYNDIIKKGQVFLQKKSFYYPDVTKYKKIGILRTASGLEKKQLSKDGKTFYLATKSSGFHIFDVSDPYDMSEISSIGTRISDFQISSDNKRVYGVSLTGGLSIIDISNPSSPKTMGNFGAGYVRQHGYQGYIRILISNDESKAFVLTMGSELYILDIKDPANIHKIGTFKTVVDGGYHRRLYKSNDDSRIYIGSGSPFSLSTMETIKVSDFSSLGLLSYFHSGIVLPEVYGSFLSSDQEYYFTYGGGQLLSFKR